jgi:hypothetical protein
MARSEAEAPLYGPVAMQKVMFKDDDQEDGGRAARRPSSTSRLSRISDEIA